VIQHVNRSRLAKAALPALSLKNRAARAATQFWTHRRIRRTAVGKISSEQLQRDRFAAVRPKKAENLPCWALSLTLKRTLSPHIPDLGLDTWLGKTTSYIVTMKTTISSKGQIVLPVEFRKQDRIEAGQQFEVERLDRGEYRLVRQSARPNEGVVDWLLACSEKGFFVPIESESTDTL